ncbi:MAG: Zn-dependent hydrolase [Bryobacteraceae bacterium]|nr:Zn-dependent hydrolase [Bryobacteraceae bacterium]
MRGVHEYLTNWMRSLGMSTRLDRAGNLRGTYGQGPAFVIASHLDTVPNAGAFDGILGVVMGIMLVELLAGEPCSVEVIGFSEEEGVRFGVPFIGSRSWMGDRMLLDRPDVAEVIRAYGLDPSADEPAGNYRGYLEFHIEQGPVLESLNLPLAVVDSIVGLSRWELTFTGHANHAGTTPMPLRRDALAAAAEWILAVEAEGQADGVATVGHLQLEPNARNAINGQVVASLDVRHPRDEVRLAAVERLLARASANAARRGVSVTSRLHLDQVAVPMDPALTQQLADAVEGGAHRMTSGAGHDAMIVAPHLPAAMLFLRSPGGVSHHPTENVLVEDVVAALQVGMRFLKCLN